VSNQLRENLTVMKRLIGDKWEASSKEYRVILLAVMAASGDTNPLACALPMAKEMSERGHSPLMLLAVATEMSEVSNVKLCGTVIGGARKEEYVPRTNAE
jgi:hypothetical protein